MYSLGLPTLTTAVERRFTALIAAKQHVVRAGKRGDFLGQASLGWADLELLPGEASRELNLTLGYRDGVPKRDQELVQGTVQMLVEAPVIEVRGERAGPYSRKPRNV